MYKAYVENHAREGLALLYGSSVIGVVATGFYPFGFGVADSLGGNFITDFKFQLGVGSHTQRAAHGRSQEQTHLAQLVLVKSPSVLQAVLSGILIPFEEVPAHIY